MLQKTLIFLWPFPNMCYWFLNIQHCKKMDVITETSLEALIQRATDPRNQNTDTAAIDAFCGIIKKEPDGAIIAARLIASKIQSQQEWEALQGLSVLEACMKNCGTGFHAEIGKFRFLNEMIKLVSPKFLGTRTPPAVRNQVLKLMYSWTMNFPKEPKIKEAYEMLKKQGVINKDEPITLEDDLKDVTPQSQLKTNLLFQDEEKVKILQKLLHSKNPDDLQAANRLIKTMVKEDERRVEVKSKRLTELETVKNNVRLLSEMLDSYRPGSASPEELELIKELHQGCERLRPNVFRLAAETQDNEEMLNQVLSVSDELGLVFDKYTSIILLGKKFESVAVPSDVKQVSSLLDLSTPSEENASVSEARTNADILSEPLSGLDLNLGSTLNTLSTATFAPLAEPTRLETLGDIFASLNPPLESQGAASVFLAPSSSRASVVSLEKSSKLKALEDLDVLGETLLQQCKMDAVFASSKSMDKSTNKESPDRKPNSQSESEPNQDGDRVNGDDLMVDLTEEVLVPEPQEVLPVRPATAEVKPLNELVVRLSDIRPSTTPPVTVIDERNGVSVVLHLARDGPREDVQVVVVTTISKNSSPLTDYLFQAVVPKGCKLKLHPPSSTELPAHNPFLPPAAITQILLIANPAGVELTLKVMLSYTMDDETVTEMGEVERLRLGTLKTDSSTGQADEAEMPCVAETRYKNEASSTFVLI